MKLEDIEAFVACVQQPSLTQAAHALGLAQPLLTRRIQRLEESLGELLLDRHSKPARPTTVGLRVYEHCIAILREAAALRAAVSAKKPVGQLRLGITHALGDIGIAPLFADMAVACPGVQMQAVTGWSGALLKRVDEGQTDAAAVLFSPNKQFPPDVEALSIGAARIVLVAKKGRLAHTACTLRELHQIGWVLNPDGCGLRSALQRALAEQDLQFKVACDAFGTDLQLGLVASGFGIGVVPAALVAGSRHCAALDMLQVVDFAPAIDLWLLHPRAPGNLALALQMLEERLSQLIAS